MSSEISVIAGLAYANDAQNIPSIQIPATFAAYNVDIVGTRFNAGVIDLTTSTGGTAIPMGDLNSIGWATFTNLDSSGIIVLQSTSGATPSVKLLPTEQCVFRLAGSTAPFAYATTCITGLTPLLEYLMLES